MSFCYLTEKFWLPKHFFKDFNEIMCMTELGFLKCENVASFQQKDILLRVTGTGNYFFKSVRASLTK
jgi:hypothetical protein